MTRRALAIAAGLALLVMLAAALYLWHARPPAPVLVTAPAAPAPAVPPPAEPVSEPATAPVPEPDLVLDLFEPTPASLDAQQQATKRRNQLEEALAVTFLLTRCKLMDQQEYSDTYNALIRYAHRAGLGTDLVETAALMQPIASAAGATYALVYSRVPCTAPSLPPALATLRHWRAQAAATVSDNSITP